MGCCMGSGEVAALLPIAPNTPDVVDEGKAGQLLIRTATFVHQSNGRLEAAYRLGRMLGSGRIYAGTFGKVYEAVHLASGTKRAVKIIDRDLLPETLFGSMISEVEILKSLVPSTQDHPHIIKVYEVIVESDYVNVVFELCTGGELFRKITATKKFSEETVAEYMQQILSAVAYCHERHIVHRDLKPENIVFESAAAGAMLKIVDFGTGVKLCSQSSLSEARGTVLPMQRYYLAPEVSSGHYDEKCDLWSCGVILYILLSGQPPLTREVNFMCEKLKNGLELKGKRHSEPVWETVSDAAKDFLRQILAINPHDRPSARALLQHPWLQSVGKRGSEATLSEQEMLQRLNDFNVHPMQSYKLKQAALTLIAAQFTSVHETERLRRKFVEMDVNKDGRLSREELMKGYSTLGFKSSVDVEKIMQECDSDRSGFIDYTEFITATMNWQQALCDYQIEAAFSAFDQDHNGKIEISEVKKVFEASKIDENDPIWQDIMKEMDVNGDGVIDLREFRQMMKRARVS